MPRLRLAWGGIVRQAAERRGAESFDLFLQSLLLQEEALKTIDPADPLRVWILAEAMYAARNIELLFPEVAGVLGSHRSSAHFEQEAEKLQGTMGRHGEIYGTIFPDFRSRSAMKQMQRNLSKRPKDEEIAECAEQMEAALKTLASFAGEGKMVETNMAVNQALLYAVARSEVPSNVRSYAVRLVEEANDQEQRMRLRLCCP